MRPVWRDPRFTDPRYVAERLAKGIRDGEVPPTLLFRVCIPRAGSGPIRSIEFETYENGDPPAVFVLPAIWQVIPNACATQAILSVLLNCAGKVRPKVATVDAIVNSLVFVLSSTANHETLKSKRKLSLVVFSSPKVATTMGPLPFPIGRLFVCQINLGETLIDFMAFTRDFPPDLKVWLVVWQILVVLPNVFCK